jgi:hypothetical protein
MPAVTVDLASLFVESDALRLAELVRQKEVTPAELTETAILLIETLDPKLNAVVIRDFARAKARAAESSPQGPLDGVPYLLKNIGAGGDSVVFGFRPQAFVTRAFVAGASGLLTGNPAVESISHSSGAKAHWPP